MKVISVETPYFPAMPGVNAAVLAVLCLDGLGKYRAYIGLVPATSEQGIAWVSSQGRKLSYSEAVPRYFVGIAAKDYAN
jgi:hypothetical protein